MKEKKEFILQLVDGVEGKSLYLNDHRICGPKPWGGGPILNTWKLDEDSVKFIKKELTKLKI